MLARGSGQSRFRLIVLMMLFCGVLSALISVNGALRRCCRWWWCWRCGCGGRRRSSDAAGLRAHSGSMLALTGTPVNVLVYEASLDAGRAGFGCFESAYAGVFLVAGTIVLALLLGSRLLPVRENRSLPPISAGMRAPSSSSSGWTSGVHQLRCAPESPLVGLQRSELDLGDRPDVTLLTVQEGGAAARRGSARSRRGPPAVAVRGRGRGGARCRPGAEPGGRRGGGVRGRALHRRLRARGGDHPAALDADRRADVPGDGHAERQPRGPGDPPAGRTTWRPGSRWPRATRCCCRARGTRSRPTSRRPRCWWSTAPTWSGGRWCRWDASAMVRSASWR